MYVCPRCNIVVDQPRLRRWQVAECPEGHVAFLVRSFWIEFVLQLLRSVTLFALFNVLFFFLLDRVHRTSYLVPVMVILSVVMVCIHLFDLYHGRRYVREKGALQLLGQATIGQSLGGLLGVAIGIVAFLLIYSTMPHQPI